MVELSASMPKDGAAAGAYIFTVAKPTLEDLKVMVLLEAAGEGFYAALCESAPNEQVRALLAKNGQEEMGHAHRVVRVIKQLYGEEFAIPAPQDNPYAMGSRGMSVSKEMLTGMVQGEIAGEGLYERWADAVGDEEAARQLRRNGKEERRHSERAEQAIALLS
jgi:rubrerythrin